MPKPILNRDLRPGDVPTTRTVALQPPGGSNNAAWTRVWRFAHTFDPAAYATGTGIDLDPTALVERFERDLAEGREIVGKCAVLRAALYGLYGWTSEGQSVAPRTAALIDALLEAIYADISGGQSRPLPTPPAEEPGMGVFGASYGSGQHRFWFTAQESLSREGLFDRVAGILLREADVKVVVSALYLQPPSYSIDGDERARNTLMLLLTERSPDVRAVHIDREYERLGRLIVSQLADRSLDHWPTE